MPSFFFCKLSLSDTRIPYLLSIKPCLISFGLPLCLHPHILSVLQSAWPSARARRLIVQFICSPISPRLLPLWLLFFRSLSPPCSCLRHHPGTLIYKLAAKAWPIPLLLLLLLQQKTERWEDSSGYAERQEGEGRAIGEDMICQPKEDDTKSLNVSKQLALICLPMPQAERKLVYLFQ